MGGTFNYKPSAINDECCVRPKIDIRVKGIRLETVRFQRKNSETKINCPYLAVVCVSHHYFMLNIYYIIDYVQRVATQYLKVELLNIYVSLSLCLLESFP